MKRKLIIISSSGLLILLVGFLLLSGITCNQTEKITQLEQKISLLKEENIPVKFKILNKKDGKISVAVKFFDSQEKSEPINRLVETFEGNELSFDFLIISVKDKKLIFTYKIYTDKIAPINGKNITDLYDKNGFPQIFYHKGIDKEFKEILSAVFTKIKTGNYDADDKYFGSMVHDVAGFKQYKEGRIYKIITRTKGGIEVLED